MPKKAYIPQNPVKIVTPIMAAKISNHHWVVTKAVTINPMTIMNRMTLSSFPILTFIIDSPLTMY